MIRDKQLRLELHVGFIFEPRWTYDPTTNHTYLEYPH
jgi:hypothetical protein